MSFTVTYNWAGVRKRLLPVFPLQGRELCKHYRRVRKQVCDLDYTVRRLEGEIAKKTREKEIYLAEVQRELEYARARDPDRAEKMRRLRDDAESAYKQLEEEKFRVRSCEERIQDLEIVLGHRNDTITDLRAELAVHPLRRWLRQLLRRKP
jgi:chromosome segregation ATPase